MSELTNKSGNGTDFRARLLATACGAALLVSLCANSAANASDGDHPLVWVELGGQFTQLDNSQNSYLPPFTLVTPRLPFITESPVAIEKPAPTSWDGNAKISFEPEGSDWVFSAAIVYGRNTRNKSSGQRTAQRTPSNPYRYRHSAYQDLSAKNTDSHMILDFSAGRDVGLGRFGSGGSSIVSAGLRYAQFDSRSNVGIQYQPTNANFFYHAVHKFYGSLDGTRKFIGVGPSLSWDASADLTGNSSAGNISLDWGLNGAVFFGRQRVDFHHQTSNITAVYVTKVPVYQHPASPNRNKEVVVPNLGGFVGISWRHPNARISFGYRADMFFGAMDGGIDTRKTYDRGFYGPFATINIGVGGN